MGAGTLNELAGLVVRMHIFTASKADWYGICDEAPQYPARPGG